MEKVIVIRYAELHLKGKNRGWFERLLIRDIKDKLADIKHIFKADRGRYIISDFNKDDINTIINKLLKVFGVYSLSVAVKCPAQIDAIKECAVELMQGKSGTFKADTNRADKSFPLTSTQISALIGGFVLENNPALRVDLFSPQTVLSIDVREEGHAFVFCDKILGAGGMPLNTAGTGLLLLSGGLDSPVAGFMAAKRGLKLVALHFNSYPYTSKNAHQKVVDLAQKLAQYTNEVRLINVKLTKIQEQIHKNCTPDYQITLTRVIMMKIAQIIAQKSGAGCLINGESLGQVASQTLESIIVTNSAVSLPVFRPLIGMDKQEIIERAKAIDTFNTSILPFEDCCTVFLPDHPVTKPSKQKADLELNKIPDLDLLIDEAIAEKEVALIKA